MKDQYQRNIETLRRCQIAYDNATPPEYDEDYDCDDENYCFECESSPCECTQCPDCKTVNGCSCDEQYEAMKDRRNGL